MEDKDLDCYFKDRSGAFDEAPGEGLWAKIEANMPPPSPSRGKGKWLLLGGALCIIGITAAWLFTRNEDKVAAPEKQQEISVVKDSATVPTAAPKIETDTILKKPATATFVIQHPAPALQTNEPEAFDTDEFTGENEDAIPVVQNAATQTANNNINTPAPPATKSIAYTTEHDRGKDAIDITITQKITPAERMSLIKNTVEKNAQYIGRTITINAKGYRIYRHTITQADYNKFGHPLDTLSPKLNLKVVTDTVFYDLMQDSLSPETIKFKSAPKAAKKQ